MARKAPPNAETEMCASVRIRAYSLGSVKASTVAVHGEIWAITATMTTGNTTRMPNTAMAMPQVRNRRRQMASMFFSTVALTTALSKERLTSRTPSTTTMNSADRAALTVWSVCHPE